MGSNHSMIFPNCTVRKPSYAQDGADEAIIRPIFLEEDAGGQADQPAEKFSNGYKFTNQDPTSNPLNLSKLSKFLKLY